MKIKASKETMLSILQPMQFVAAGRGALPILNNVLAEAKDGKLWLMGTDGDLTVRVSAEVEVLEEGATTLPPKQLFVVFRDMGADTATLTVDAEQHGFIEAANERYRVAGLPPESFPSLPEVAGGAAYTLDQAALKNMFRLTSYAAVAGADRPLLNSVLMSFAEGKLSVVATDSRRLALVEQDVEMAPGEALSVIVPLKTVHQLTSMLGEEGTVEVRAGDRQVAFRFGAVEMVSKQMEGKYPNYRQVIPNGETKRATMERETFLTAVRRTSQALMGTGNGVRLGFKANRLEVSASGDAGEAQETLDVKYDGPELSISFNPAFLMEPLKALTTDEVYLDLENDMNPGTMRSSVNFVYVLMPIRLS